MIKRIVLCLMAGMISQFINAQIIDITIFEFISVRNNYIHHFNSVNKEIDSLMSAKENRLNSQQKDSLYRFEEYYKSQHIPENLTKDVLGARVYISKSDLDLLHETYILTIESFENFIKEKADRINQPTVVSYPEWENRNDMLITEIQNLQNFLSGMDRTVSLYLSQIEYLMHTKNVNELDVSYFLSQNEHFDYYGILKKGIRLQIDKEDLDRYKSYYEWLTRRENEYARKRLNIINSVN